MTGTGDESAEQADALAGYERAVNIHEPRTHSQSRTQASNETESLVLARAAAEVRRAAVGVRTARAAVRKAHERRTRPRLDGQRAVNIATGMLMDRLTITADAALALLLKRVSAALAR